MVHGILQFTPSIAFRYVLHRCESRDIRCRESFRHIEDDVTNRTHTVSGATGKRSFIQVPWRNTRRCSFVRPRGSFKHEHRDATHKTIASREKGTRSRKTLSPQALKHVLGSFCWAGFDNDPSAGSPTETLLRLLLPLNDKVQWTSRDVADSEPPTSPRSENFTGPFNR